MDIELGIQNVARAVTFSTEESAEAVNAIISAAVAENKPIVLNDDKGRRIIVPAGALCDRRFRNQACRRLRGTLIGCTASAQAMCAPYALRAPSASKQEGALNAYQQSSGQTAGSPADVQTSASTPRSTIRSTVAASVRFSPNAFGFPAPCQSDPPVTSSPYLRARSSKRRR